MKLLTTRQCLRCQCVFGSQGRHNRLCDACRAHATQIRKVEEDQGRQRLERYLAAEPRED